MRSLTWRLAAAAYAGSHIFFSGKGDVGMSQIGRLWLVLGLGAGMLFAAGLAAWWGRGLGDDLPRPEAAFDFVLVDPPFADVEVRYELTIEQGQSADRWQGVLDISNTSSMPLRARIRCWATAGSMGGRWLTIHDVAIASLSSRNRLSIRCVNPAPPAPSRWQLRLMRGSRERRVDVPFPALRSGRWSGELINEELWRRFSRGLRPG